MMTASVNAPLLPGLPDPVLDSQRVFRAVLDALARPGHIIPSPVMPEAPRPLTGVAAALALTLLDFETPLWLDADMSAGGVAEYLRFHCGMPLVTSPDEAQFALVTTPATMPALKRFNQGIAEYPERSTTVIVQVSGLTGGRAVTLRGPGIDGEARLAVAGLPDSFWPQWDENRALFPCGVDVIFAGPDGYAALPRSTRVEI